MARGHLLQKQCKIELANKCCNWFEEIGPALKAHHDSPKPHRLSPQQVHFGPFPVGRGLPLSSHGIAVDAM